ncbi:MAG: nucleotidyltransferase substrate binding protein [bacterium]
MELKRKDKLKTAYNELKETVLFYESNKDVSESIRFNALAKAFEVAVEYGWKELKFRVEEEGLEVYSPKEAVRQAAKIGVIEDASLWIDFIKARNEGVHDYFEIPEEDYFKLAKSYLKVAKNII